MKIPLLGLPIDICVKDRCLSSFCDTPVFTSVHNCQCYPNCHSQGVGDCCVGYELECINATYTSHGRITQERDEALLRQQSDRVARRRIVERDGRERCFTLLFYVESLSPHRSATLSSYALMYRMVSTCPKDWRDRAIGDRCAAYDNSTHLSLLSPVFDGAKLYRNRYCALCNGVSRVDIMTPGLICEAGSNLTNLYIKQVVNEMGNINKTALLNYSCQLGFETSVYLLNSLRSASCVQGVIEDCPSTFSPNTSRNKMIARACLSYTAIVIYERDIFDKSKDRFTKTIFKNPHCAFCHGVSPLTQRDCYEIVMKYSQKDGAYLLKLTNFTVRQERDSAGGATCPATVTEHHTVTSSTRSSFYISHAKALRVYGFLTATVLYVILCFVTFA